MSGPLILSIFPGIDLLGRAFEEVWSEACIVRGPDLIFGGDIRTFHPPAGKFDGVIGGPPCQAFSGLSNLQRRQGREPKHGNLIPEFERVVNATRPDWFLMENVTAAPVPAVPGYIIKDHLLNNRWLGEPQNRMRRFSFGTKDGRPLHVELAALETADWQCAVTAAHGGERKTHFNRKTGGKIQRYLLADACELQGLARDFFDGMPFRRDGALQMAANGVPLPMGRAIAKAVKRALEDKT